MCDQFEINVCLMQSVEYIIKYGVRKNKIANLSHVT